MARTCHYLLIVIFFLQLNAVAQEVKEKITVIQNIDARDVTSLKVLWQAIVDPLENGYYNHRYLPKEKDGYFENKKPLIPWCMCV